MATKKKNKLIPLIAMLLVVAALGAVYFILDRMDLNAEPETDSGVFSIQSKSTDDIVSLTFNDKNGDAITFVKEESLWYYKDEKDFPVDQSAVTELLSGLGTILATREFDEDNGNFGLDAPQNVISATYAEDEGDTVVTYTIGDTNSFNSGTYIRDDATGKIYLGSSNPASAFADKVKNDFIKLDIAAYDVEPTSTHTVTVTGADGSQNIITDVDGIEEFLGDPFGNIDCTDWVEYNCDDADMAKYGITKGSDRASILLNYKTTVSVTDENGESTPMRQEATYNIWFGDTLEDGSVYYTITDSSFVYKLSKDKYDLAMSYLTYEPKPETETSDVTEALTEA